MNERERDKNAARRLAILRHAEEVTGNVALICDTGSAERSNEDVAPRPRAGTAVADEKPAGLAYWVMERSPM